VLLACLLALAVLAIAIAAVLLRFALVCCLSSLVFYFVESSRVLSSGSSVMCTSLIQQCIII
jgi:hypothetical protein